MKAKKRKPQIRQQVKMREGKGEARGAILLNAHHVIKAEDGAKHGATSNK